MTVKAKLTQKKFDQVKESVLQTIQNKSRGEWCSFDDIIGALETEGIFVIDSEENKSNIRRERSR